MRRFLQHNSAARRTHLAQVAAAILFAAAEAAAQDKQPGSAKLAAPGAPGQPAQQQKTQVTRRIIVSIPDHKLALLEDGRVVKIYSVAVGADVSPSPTGALTIIHRVTSPTYYRPGVVIPPGKSNPVGTRWIGLSEKGYGIHGTNQPSSIGRNASHGCIRMRNSDVEDLFARVRVGDAVEIYPERTAETAALFGGAAQPRVVTADVAAVASPAGNQN